MWQQESWGRRTGSGVARFAVVAGILDGIAPRSDRPAGSAISRRGEWLI